MPSKVMDPTFMFQLTHTRVNPAGQVNSINIEFLTGAANSRESGPSLSPRREPLFIHFVSFWSRDDQSCLYRHTGSAIPNRYSCAVILAHPIYRIAPRHDHGGIDGRLTDT